MTYKCLSAFEQVQLQKLVERMNLIALAMAIIAFVIGCLLGSISNKVTKESANEWFNSISLAEQTDFLIANLKDAEKKRAIAINFCSLNPNARNICANAKLISPVRNK